MSSGIESDVNLSGNLKFNEITELVFRLIHYHP